MHRFKYLIAIASIVMLAGCSIGSSSDQNGDDETSSVDSGSISVPWDEPDVTDVTIDPTEVVDTSDDVTPEADPVVEEESYDPLSVTPAGPNLDAGTVGVDYGTFKIRAHGGSGSYMMTVEGTLPPGLEAKCGAHECDGAEDVETVKLRGTPTQAGIFEFTISIEDMNDEGTSLTQAFTIKIEDAEEAQAATPIKFKIPKMKGKMRLGLADADEELAVNISDIITDTKDAGTLRASTSIDLKITGGKAEFTWDAPLLYGEAFIDPDENDSSRAKLTMTKVFPGLEDPNLDPIVPITISATDADGETDSIVIDLRITYPRPTMKDLEVLGLTEGGFWEQSAVDLTFYDSADEMIARWQTPGKVVDGRDPFGEFMLEEGTAFDSKLETIKAIRLDRCRGAIDPNIKTASPTPCTHGGVKSVNYTSIKVRSAYWEATYAHNYFLHEGYPVLIADIIPNMEGFVDGEPDSVWQRRADVLPPIIAGVASAVSDVVGDVVD
jgi:hypothetical protein